MKTSISKKKKIITKTIKALCAINCAFLEKFNLSLKRSKFHFILQCNILYMYSPYVNSTVEKFH